ncbi:bis(5'-adenosyl)-triphosphatase [Anaeramoeba flamelloides]|uniref:Bis(5'-adenosyl)-triphosphatase n=1 Tax=Anaeramoeba flamelloides TaxID=1746091 RepID=A0ABQ8XVH6_9EUKA|nr:bis(5'-adenosyl)-triphosphatase [Anaeramoeba flamelloides]
MFGKYKIDPREIFHVTNLSFCIVNYKPVLPGHVLVVPLRIVKNFEDLKPEEVTDLFCTAQLVCKALRVAFNGQSFTLSIQDGPQAGQTVEHVHLHILPRLEGDRFSGEKNDEIYTEINKAENNFKPRSMEEMEKEAELLKRQIQIQLGNLNNNNNVNEENSNEKENQKNEITENN